jgi:hypothetical protein
LGNITARDVLLTGALTGLTSMSDITASSSANLGSLKTTITSLGNINTSTLTLPASLSNVRSLGALTASQVSTTAPVTFGSTNFGSSAGAIIIGNSSTTGTNSLVTFGFTSYNQNPLIGGTPLFANSTIVKFARP